MIFFAATTTLILWMIGSIRRLILVKRRVQRDWDNVSFFLHERWRLTSKEEDKETIETQSEVIACLKKVDQKGGPLKTSLRDLEKAERTLQTLLQQKEPPPFAQIKEKLFFATQTYNDGVRLLYRLKRLPFHLPASLIICSKRIDLFETDPSMEQTLKLPLNLNLK